MLIATQLDALGFRAYEQHTANAGLSKMHGLRHAYAQRRYEELAGWKAPAAGGPVTRSLSPGQKVIDRHARQTISRELGHERELLTPDLVVLDDLFLAQRLGAGFQNRTAWPRGSTGAAGRGPRPWLREREARYAVAGKACGPCG